jgi:hypothetical protein
MGEPVPDVDFVIKTLRLYELLNIATPTDVRHLSESTAVQVLSA